MTRISRESRAVAQLVDVFEDRLYVYIVMDLLEGGDLEQLLEVSFLCLIPSIFPCP
jgi:serine/threonine protein kinase